MTHFPPAGAGQPQFGAEAILDTVFAGAPVGFAFLDRELRYVRVNDTLAEVNGHPAAAHIGRTLFDVFPDFAPEVITVFRRVLESGEPVLALEIDGAALGRPTESRTWEVNLFPVRCPAATVIGLGVVTTDVTERKRLEDQLRQAL